MLVGGKKNIRPAIIIDIACCYASAIVKIAVVKNVELIGVFHLVGKIYACLAAIEKREQGVAGRF